MGLSLRLVNGSIFALDAHTLRTLTLCFRDHIAAYLSLVFMIYVSLYFEAP